MSCFSSLCLIHEGGVWFFFVSNKFGGEFKTVDERE